MALSTQTKLGLLNFSPVGRVTANRYIIMYSLNITAWVSVSQIQIPNKSYDFWWIIWKQHRQTKGLEEGLKQGLIVSISKRPNITNNTEYWEQCHLQQWKL